MPIDAKGQKALYEVGKYFDKGNVKPPESNPDKDTQMSGQENIEAVNRYFKDGETETIDARKNIKAVNRYFKGGAYDYEIFLALLFPAILILLFLLIYRRGSGKALEIEKIPEKDLDFIEMVRLQKGLEEFDRDFLLQLSLENTIQPIYQILIDKDVFEKIESKVIDEISEKGESSNSNKRVKYLRKLKMKLF